MSSKERRDNFWALFLLLILFILVVFTSDYINERHSCERANDLREPFSKYLADSAHGLAVRSKLENATRQEKQLNVYRIKQLNRNASLLTPLDCDFWPETEGSTQDNLPEPVFPSGLPTVTPIQTPDFSQEP